MTSVVRILGVFFGIIFLLGSFGLLLGGTVVIVVNESLSDSEGFISTPSYNIQNPTASALVFNSLEFNSESPNKEFNINVNNRWTPSFSPGDFVTVKISAENMFIGIGLSSDVLSYLENVSYLGIVNINLNSMELVVENSEQTGNLTTNLPGTQSDFTWIAQGVSQLLWNPDVDSLNQELAIVVMNADGTAGLDTSVSAGAQIPILRAIGVGMLVFGIILLILAIVFFVVAAKSKGRPKANRYRIYRDPVAPIVKPEQPDLQYCANCGSQIDSDSRFCASCGEPVFNQGTPSPKAVASSQQTAQVQLETQKPSAQLPHNAYVVADWGTRFWAFLIDVIIINMVVESVRWAFIALTQSWNFVTDWTFFSFGFSINTVAMLLYFGFVEGNYGTTLGKQALGLIVVTEQGEKLNLGEGFLSAIGKAFLLPIDVIIGLLIQDPPAGKNITLNQRLFQRISKTTTVFRPSPDSKPGNNFLSSKLLN